MQLFKLHSVLTNKIFQKKSFILVLIHILCCNYQHISCFSQHTKKVYRLPLNTCELCIMILIPCNMKNLKINCFKDFQFSLECYYIALKNRLIILIVFIPSQRHFCNAFIKLVYMNIFVLLLFFVCF